MAIYYKVVNSRELEFNWIASSAGISPEITSVVDEENGYLLGTVKYTPLQELEIEKRKVYTQQIKDQILKLHQLDIYHGDLTEDNIVIDLNTGNAFLIEFRRSKFISEITDSDLEENFFGEQSEDLEDFLSKEFEQIDFIMSLSD